MNLLNINSRNNRIIGVSSRIIKAIMEETSLRCLIGSSSPYQASLIRLTSIIRSNWISGILRYIKCITKGEIYYTNLFIYQRFHSSYIFLHIFAFSYSLIIHLYHLSIALISLFHNCSSGKSTKVYSQFSSIFHTSHLPQHYN